MITLQPKVSDDKVTLAHCAEAGDRGWAAGKQIIYSTDTACSRKKLQNPVNYVFLVTDKQLTIRFRSRIQSLTFLKRTICTTGIQQFCGRPYWGTGELMRPNGWGGVIFCQNFVVVIRGAFKKFVDQR